MTQLKDKFSYFDFHDVESGKIGFPNQAVMFGKTNFRLFLKRAVFHFYPTLKM